ncbi:hypothetical protein DM02DRAFT_681232 [Periconia macrospinosa]|uniref:Uncharacterized protein n=1 Tax=Periconia macrospinosa TaxID=97972 RepID=A0A2V1DKL8_9PLEO|nr:hypothetical protein DM02DRAFT_681232 [Periconia macrospinosa]
MTGAEKKDPSKLLTTAANIFSCLVNYNNRELILEALHSHMLMFLSILDGDPPRKLQGILYDALERQISDAVESLVVLFRENKKTIEDAMGDLTGALDDKPTSRDTALGSLLHSFHAHFISGETPPTEGKKKELTEAKKKDLISEAARWIQTYKLDEDQTYNRLGRTLGNIKSGRDIVNLLYDLALPQLTLNTFVRFIRVFTMAKTPNILYGLPGTSTTTHTPSREIKQAFVSQDKSGFSDAAMKKARESLSLADDKIPFQQLVPVEKQHVLRLLECLHAKRTPQQGAPHYNLFGYSACKTMQQTEQLSLIYKKILIECRNKNDAFEVFWRAMVRYGILDLIDKKGYREDRKTIPELAKELSYPLKGDESVWVLKAFLRAAADSDPPDCLIRDFGFHLCTKREETVYLKAVYSQLLQKCSVSTLHEACMAGKLRELSRSYGIPVDENKQRLLGNQIGAAGVGYQTTDREFWRKGGIYKSSKKQALYINDRYIKLAREEFEQDRKNSLRFG